MKVYPHQQMDLMLSLLNGFSTYTLDFKDAPIHVNLLARSIMWLNQSQSKSTINYVIT